MGISRVATFKSGNTSCIVESDEGIFTLKATDLLGQFNTAGKILTECNKYITKDSIFFHKNRDGTIAIATGAEPDIWPEDESEPKEPK